MPQWFNKSIVAACEQTLRRLQTPQNMQPIFAAIHNGGTSVNGVNGAPSVFVMEKGATLY